MVSWSQSNVNGRDDYNELEETRHLPQRPSQALNHLVICHSWDACISALDACVRVRPRKGDDFHLPRSSSTPGMYCIFFVTSDPQSRQNWRWGYLANFPAGLCQSSCMIKTRYLPLCTGWFLPFCLASFFRCGKTGGPITAFQNLSNYGCLLTKIFLQFRSIYLPILSFLRGTALTDVCISQLKRLNWMNQKSIQWSRIPNRYCR